MNDLALEALSLTEFQNSWTQQEQDENYISQKYMFRGLAGMTSTERRALGEQQVDAAALGQGYYLVPKNVARETLIKIKALNPLRKNGAQLYTNCGMEFALPVVTANADITSIVRDNTTGAVTPQTLSPTFDLSNINTTGTAAQKTVRLFPKPRYVQVTVSNELLEDTEEKTPNLEKLLQQLFAEQFAAKEVFDTFQGTGTVSTGITAQTIGLSVQLSQMSRQQVLPATVTDALWATYATLLTDMALQDAIWIVHPNVVNRFTAFSGMRPLMQKDGRPCLMLGANKVFLCGAIAASATSTTQALAYFINPTSYAYCETGSPLLFTRLDELQAASGQTTFQAMRRYDCICTDTTQALSFLSA